MADGSSRARSGAWFTASTDNHGTEGGAGTVVARAGKQLFLEPLCHCAGVVRNDDN